MNTIDLTQFQFDYDQTWAVLFLRSDGTVLARYGSRNATDAMTLNSMAGLQTTMRRVLQAHRQWPKGKDLYQDKRGPKAEFETVARIPSPTIRKVLGQKQDQKASCIHCHNVYDAHREVAINNGDYDPRKRWKYPFPENAGFSVDPVSGTKVTKVLGKSAASAAGLAVGDEVVSINGQAIHSLADIQFALHFLPSAAVAQIVTARDGENRTGSLRLRAGWREGDISWRVSMYGMPPQPRLWVEAVKEGERKRLKVESDRLALKVRGVFGEDVRRGGLKRGDVIVNFDGRENHHSPGQFHAQVRLNYFRPNSVLPLTVIRGQRRVRLKVEFRNR